MTCPFRLTVVELFPTAGRNDEKRLEDNMSKMLRNTFLMALAGCLLLTQPLLAQDGMNGNLVTVKWLQNNLSNPGVLVLDASSAQAYAKQHIPGAVGVPMIVVNYPMGMQEMPLPQMEKLYQETGISNGKKIVMYDQGGDEDATRLFFSLYYHGLPATNLFILDGGLSKWQAEGLPVTKDPTTAPKSSSFKIEKTNESARAKTPEVVTASGDTTNNVLVDALDANWHFGQIAPFNKAGHIPNSVLAHRGDFYNPDKTFKSPEEIRKMLAYLGIRPEQHVYSYCGGGVAASVPYFAAKFIAGYPNVKLYDASEIGWLSDQRDLPLWTYDAPFLMRDAKWLQFWDSQMLRMYVGPQITVVDVRPADEFNQGHVPFALNIPGDVFKSNINNPAKLAEILGADGVNASHEAVVLSGAGLTKDSALAYVALEKLGQKKVSVLMDPKDKWAQPGFALTNNPTAVGPKKNPMDLSIVPTPYPANLRPDVIIADAKASHGIYPKVFVASGKDMPTKAQDGKVIHVPYTDLLNADGTPKAAKDIWTVLAKAGVPRYAEIVCFSDDPGEAAANYYVLKLMGFPDVKILAM
jgi:thiosulfate/3-mercaptopyruvate sulfurtransferase